MGSRAGHAAAACAAFALLAARPTGGGVASASWSLAHAGAVGGIGAPMSAAGFSVLPGPPSHRAPSPSPEAGPPRAYPTPFVPSRGHDRIVFAGLPTRAAIRVYTLSGERVRELSKEDLSAGSLTWRPVVNEQGSPLASGVYLYVISAPGAPPAKGKLMVVK